MKRHFLSLFLLVGYFAIFMSCQTKFENTLSETPDYLEIKTFYSREELLDLINCKTSTIAKSGGVDPEPFPEGEDDETGGLLVEVSCVDIYSDPVICIDCEDVIGTPLIEEEDLTVYEAAGYDELVPNLNLARYLNARGEIQVCDTIYKISSTGTYFFEPENEAYFTAHYGEFQESSGSYVSDGLVLMAPGIYRYDTFSSGSTHQVWHADPSGGVQYDNGESSLAGINWNDFQRIDTDAVTWVGGILQSVIGRNKAFDYYFSSDKRMTAKLYYYNYLFYSESGAVVKMQKKHLGAWVKEDADELFLEWGPMIYKTTYVSNPSETLPSDTAISVSKSHEIFPGSTEYVTAAYILGISLSQADLNNLVGKTAKKVLTFLNNKINGHGDISDCNIVHIITPVEIYTVILANNDNDYNENKLKCVFLPHPHVGIVIENLLNLPGSVLYWVMAVCRGTISIPRPSLIQGEVKLAAKYNGEVGAMTLYKD